ncbi:MAG: hypothetical protein HY062_02480 [Bacteroidetes bacterium]|nr:hypothetical protein [Bacteroidota bacterium]
MDTRMQLKVIIDYNEVYGSSKSMEDALDLIKDIPSVTLISYISGFNIKLYLKDVGIEAHEIQIQLLNNLIVKAGEDTIERFKVIFQNHLDKGHWPVVIWRYSNLLFYELIFKKHNSLKARDLTNEEAKRVLDAYLIINTITSNRFKISENEVKEAAKNEETESIILPNFIYQKDYTSTTDFSNQLTRGVKLFEYLEKSEKYSQYIEGYYKLLKVKNSNDLFHNILTVFTQVNITGDIAQRHQIIPLWNLEGFINTSYINTLAINPFINSYEADVNFSLLRNHILYEVGGIKLIYFLLDINFLIDLLYKAQIFAFKDYIKNQGYKGNFLAEKGKEFMEDIYFRLIMEKCFPHLIGFSGDKAIKKDKNEISDYYLRKNEKIALIEFKDVLLGADVKEKGEKDGLYSALDTKFYENQKKDPKGIRQLLNGIEYIENNQIEFDSLIHLEKIEIYPIVIYTDLSFGYEGVNKILNKKFREELAKRSFNKIEVKNVTFINLSFFELHEDYLKQNRLDLFKMIDEFHLHVSNKDVSTTPFEVFSRFYMQENIKKDLGNPSFMLEVIKDFFPEAKL